MLKELFQLPDPPHHWDRFQTIKYGESDQRIRSCAIPYCEFEDDEKEKLYPICKDHFLHRGCLRRYLRNNANPTCPVCKDDFLFEMRDLMRDNPYTFQRPPTPDPLPVSLSQSITILRQRIGENEERSENLFERANQVIIRLPPEDDPAEHMERE